MWCYDKDGNVPQRLPRDQTRFKGCGKGRILLNLDESFIPYFLTDTRGNVASLSKTVVLGPHGLMAA